MEITEIALGKQCRSEGCLDKLLLSVRAEQGCDSSSHALLICTTPSFKKMKHAIKISHMNLIPVKSVQLPQH